MALTCHADSSYMRQVLSVLILNSNLQTLLKLRRLNCWCRERVNEELKTAFFRLSSQLTPTQQQRIQSGQADQFLRQNCLCFPCSDVLMERLLLVGPDSTRKDILNYMTLEERTFPWTIHPIKIMRRFESRIEAKTFCLLANEKLQKRFPILLNPLNYEMGTPLRLSGYLYGFFNDMPTQTVDIFIQNMNTDASCIEFLLGYIHGAIVSARIDEVQRILTPLLIYADEHDVETKIELQTWAFHDLIFLILVDYCIFKDVQLLKKIYTFLESWNIIVNEHTLTRITGSHVSRCIHRFYVRLNSRFWFSNVCVDPDEFPVEFKRWKCI